MGFLIVSSLMQGGNLIYALTIYVNRWYMMLIGRLIAGTGASILATGSLYITWTTNFEDRQTSLGYYRLSQSFAR